jgi:hypothetical protein
MPAAYIVSKNIERRSLNKGQRALLAKMYPEPQPGRRTDLKSTSLKFSEVTRQHLGFARIARQQKALANAMSGGLTVWNLGSTPASLQAA